MKDVPKEVRLLAKEFVVEKLQEKDISPEMVSAIAELIQAVYSD